MHHPNPNRITSRVFLCDCCGSRYSIPGLTPEAELAEDLGYGLATVWAENYSICDACWVATYAAGAKPLPGDDVIDLTDGGAR